MNTCHTFSSLRIYLAVLLAAVTFAAGAQSRIDRVLNDLEKQADVETTYSERRTMKKHELYRTTTMMTFTRQEYYNKLAKAFEEERSNAVSAIKNSGQRTYRFEDKKSQSSYTLTSSDGKYTVVKSWSLKDVDDEAYNDLDDNEMRALATEINMRGQVIEVRHREIGAQRQACEAHRQAIRARQQAVEGRRHAMEARRQACEARRQAMEARREAQRQAREARQEARRQAREARLEAERQACEARRHTQQI